MASTSDERDDALDYLCVLDFEATCETREQMQKGDMEIIEFPTVLVNLRTMQREAEFQRFVHTKRFPVSPYCTEVTGITQVRPHSTVSAMHSL